MITCSEFLQTDKWIEQVSLGKKQGNVFDFMIWLILTLAVVVAVFPINKSFTDPVLQTALEVYQTLQYYIFVKQFCFLLDIQLLQK